MSRKTRIKSLSVGRSLSSSGTVNIRIKHSLSKQHLRGARFFAKQALAVAEAGRPMSEDLTGELRAYVIAAVMSAVSGLEAFVNELYIEVRDGEPKTMGKFEDRSISLMVQLWDDIERLPILEKYQRALLLSGLPPFERGRPPFQEADSLVKLRDNLIHYRPEWNDSQGRHETLERRLQDRFSLNPTSEGELWFPHQCLSAGCAAWAGRVAAEFMRDFCTRLGIPQRFPD